VSTLAEEAEVILAAVAVLAAVSGAVILATTVLPAVSVAVTSAEVFRGGFGGLYGFGGASPYYGYGHDSWRPPSGSGLSLLIPS
jgi:hypothetical protein